MPQPRSLTGARRDEALRRLAGGESAQKVADALGASRGAILRLQGREAASAARRPAAPPKNRPQPSPKATRTGSAPPRSDDDPSPTTDEILDDDVRIRVEARDTVLELLREARIRKDAYEVGRLTQQLNATLDGLRRAVATVAPVTDEGVDEEVASFDQMMMRLVERGRRIRDGAVVGVPGEPEPAGEVGDRARSAG